MKVSKNLHKIMPIVFFANHESAIKQVSSINNKQVKSSDDITCICVCIVGISKNCKSYDFGSQNTSLYVGVGVVCVGGLLGFCVTQLSESLS